MEDNARGNGIGLASILMIIAILAFTSFGVLAMVSAKVDLGFSNRSIEYMEQYYKAEEGINNQIIKLEETEQGNREIRQKIRDGLELVVNININEDGSIIILSKQVQVTENDYNTENEMNIWKRGK